MLLDETFGYRIYCRKKNDDPIEGIPGIDGKISCFGPHTEIGDKYSRNDIKKNPIQSVFLTPLERELFLDENGDFF